MKRIYAIILFALLPALMYAGGVDDGSAEKNSGSFANSLPMPTNITDIKSNCLELKQSAEKLRNSVKDAIDKEKKLGNNTLADGKKYLADGKSALDNLIGVFDGTGDLQADQIKDLVNNVKNSLKAIREEESGEYSELKTQFDQFVELAKETINRITDVFSYGVYYAAPFKIRKDVGEFGIELSVDTFKYVQGNNAGSNQDDKTTIDAHVELQLPFLNSANGGDIVRFEGKDIKIRGGADVTTRLALTSNPTVKIKEGVYLTFVGKLPKAAKGKINCAEKDSSWIDFNCKGIEGFNLVACVSFARDFLIPATPVDPNNAPKVQKTAKDSVKGYFVIGADGGLIASMCFDTPFKVSGCGDFIFTIKNALVDFSSQRNSPSFTFPVADYWEEESGVAKEAWKGFFLDQMDVEFPSDFKMNKNQQNGATQVKLSKMLIDHHGFSGKVTALNLLNTYPEDGGKGNAGLDVAIDTIMMVFLKSRPINGLIAGRARASFIQGKQKKQTQPAANQQGNGEKKDDEVEMEGQDFALRGSVGYNKELNKYLYDVKITSESDNTYDVPFTKKAHITVNRGSFLEVYNDADKNFAARLNMSGKLSIDTKIQLEGVSFEGLQISTARPHVSIKSLALVGNLDLSFGGMGIQLHELGWKGSDSYLPLVQTKWADADDAGALTIDAQINLIPGNNTLSVRMGADIITGHVNKWKFAKLRVGKICLGAHFSVFSFDGCIERFDGDEVWGDGFYGDLKLGIEPLGFGIEGMALFGHTNEGHRYWMAKAEVDFEGFPVLVFPPCVYMKSAMGGAYQGLKRKPEYEAFYDKNTGNVNWPALEICKDVFVPSEDGGLGLVLGIGVYAAQKNTLSANAALEIAFTPKWGLAHVTVTGNATILGEMGLTKMVEKVATVKNQVDNVLDKVGNSINMPGLKLDAADLSNKNNSIAGAIGGKMVINYDNINKSFFSVIDINADLAGIIKGHAVSELYADSKEWYFYLGRRDRPVELTILDLFSAQTYFMLGKVPTTLRPLDEELAAQFDIFDVDQSTVQSGDVNTGKGFAFGAMVKMDAKVKLPFDIIWASFNAGAGTDLLVSDRTKCGGQEKMKWRAQGDVYATLSAKVGATVPLIFKKLKFNIFRGGATVLLVGKLPAPVYGEADIKFDCKIFCIPFPKVNIEVKLGKDC